jgi:hypothetical protein
MDFELEQPTSLTNFRMWAANKKGAPLWVSLIGAETLEGLRAAPQLWCFRASDSGQREDYPPPHAPHASLPAFQYYRVLMYKNYGEWYTGVNRIEFQGQPGE